MPLISEEYRRLNRDLHGATPDFGAGETAWYDETLFSIIARSHPKTVLDYGCGKGRLKPTLKSRFPKLIVREYDPAIPGKDVCTKSVDGVICGDVMEHIEPAFLEDVLMHIRKIMGTWCVACVTHVPALKTLADGRNAHLIQEPPAWWHERFARHFSVQMATQLTAEGKLFSTLFILQHPKPQIA